MSENTDETTEWTDNRPIQETIVEETARAEKTARIDRGASDEFADDRQEIAEPDTGSQATLGAETADENQRDLTGEIARELPEWAETED